MEQTYTLAPHDLINTLLLIHRVAADIGRAAVRIAKRRKVIKLSLPALLVSMFSSMLALWLTRLVGPSAVLAGFGIYGAASLLCNTYIITRVIRGKCGIDYLIDCHQRLVG